MRSLLLDASATPNPAAPDYVVAPTPNAAAARRVLGGIETRLAAVYADLVAASTGATRVLAINALTESTVRATRWGRIGADLPRPPRARARGHQLPVTVGSTRR